MLPYADLPYFVLVLLAALPALLLGMAQRSRAWWILATAVFMAVVHWGPSFNTGWGLAARDLWVAAGYALWQLVLAVGFARWRQRGANRLVFAAIILASLAPLILVKLVPLFAPATRVGFLGLSYLTFRALDVLIAIQDRLLAAVAPSRYVAYLLFFPTVSAGPIDRYRRFTEDLAAVPSRADFLADLDHGVKRIFAGLLYKFIVAALIQRYWLEPAANTPGWAGLLSYAYAYSLYLFFDFAGYSAIALGVSRFFGIRVPENFDRPFLAANIVEFWNRWHISLSTWFRDHIYMRFVIAATKGKWFAGRYLASSVGFFVTFVLMGAWHGLEGHYLLYGLYHAGLFIGHGLFARWARRWPGLGTSRGWRVVSVVVTFNAVCFGFLIFSGRLG
jgi:membrane protein involved in D-alanine export